MDLSHGTRNVTSSRYGLSIYHSTQYDCTKAYPFQLIILVMG